MIAELADLSSTREAKELLLLPRLLEGCDLFVDIGAHEGLYLYHAAKALSGAKLVAIEANPALIPSLSIVVESLRGEGSPNEYEIVPVAISDEARTLDFYVDKDNSQSALFPGPGRDHISVPSRPLDDFYRPAKRAFIKIDVEGAEYRVIQSGTRFLQAGAVYFVELHGWGDPETGKYPTDVCGLFFRNGYAVKRVGSHFLFHKAGPGERILSHILALPWILPKSLVYRYAPSLGQGLRRWKDRLAGFKRK